jgi:hypothetical protein
MFDIRIELVTDGQSYFAVQSETAGTDTRMNIEELRTQVVRISNLHFIGDPETLVVPLSACRIRNHSSCAHSMSNFFFLLSMARFSFVVVSGGTGS